ncbi:hypothetical protein [Kaistella flava (ex Peng et al. 2021)]|uniref:hypothetical protein n=1 Tax=Kaistella flava (ex Peng et al. 2021) TaxID=2038776 RepID=UPI0018824ED5|nr:hypothetical protein [Kaistella flava (ex Peng et al. 2021)]
MKNAEILDKKIPLVAIDRSLDKLRNKIMFPKKLEKANEMLLTAKLPKNKHVV